MACTILERVTATMVRADRPWRPWSSRAGGMAWVTFLAMGLPRCDSAYPIAPTACDDWCRVTQRAGCEEDYPEQCVSRCEERAIGRRFPRCEEDWLSLTECYRMAPDSDFLCVEEGSRPAPICIDERVALAGCANPLRARCLETCLHEARDCRRPALDCDGRCRFRIENCETQESALYDCQLRGPSDCQDPATDMRDVTEIPCIAEIGTLLECAGAGEPSAP